MRVCDKLVVVVQGLRWMFKRPKFLQFAATPALGEKDIKARAIKSPGAPLERRMSKGGQKQLFYILISSSNSKGEKIDQVKIEDSSPEFWIC